MKIDISCMQCVQSGEALKGLHNIQVEAELNDDGFYEATCDKGHHIIAVTQNPKYELLFDLGGLALLDGYAREAVSSFAASLERFFEFFLRIISFSKSLDAIALEETWKQIKSQSERQLGAYLFVYALTYGRSAPKIDQKMVEFRNNVIHKGYIPSELETREYAQFVGSYIECVANELHELDDEAFMAEVFFRFENLRSKVDESDVNMTTMAIPTMLSTSQRKAEQTEFDIDRALQSLESSRTYVYSDFRKAHEREHRYELLEKIFGRNL